MIRPIRTRRSSTSGFSASPVEIGGAGAAARERRDGRLAAALRLMAALGAVAAPALAAQVVAAQSAAAQTVLDPYAWSGPQRRDPPTPTPASTPTPTWAPTFRAAPYGGPQAYDRYGGGMSHPPVYAAPPAPAYAQMLSWPGKVDRAAAAPTADLSSRYGAPQSALAVNTPWSATMAGLATDGEPPAQTWPAPPPMTPAAAYAPPRSASIYDPPPRSAHMDPAPMEFAPMESAAGQSAAGPSGEPGSTRRYSVHREYGMTPDPIPLPPQFFGQTADLTQPETPEPQRRVAGGDGKARNPLQPAESP